MKLFLFTALLIINLIIIISLLFHGVRLLLSFVLGKKKERPLKALKKSGIFSLSALSALLLLILATQLLAHTPKIRDTDGKVISGSIAELKKVEVNGHKEWISIRGYDENAPVLLFLAGGPGGTQMAATRYELSELEKHYVVVNWDQPGSGKSYSAMNREAITISTYVDDGTAITEYLLKRFEKDKIYLIGESWGSALGVFMIDKQPAYYESFIGTGQMVDFEETEILDYNMALSIAKSKNDIDTVKKLEDQGKPWYHQGNISLLSASYLNLLSGEMASNPNITNGGFHTFRDMFSEEYGILDSIHFMTGVLNTFNVVYPQLYETDLREQYATLEVPVYFFLGKYDINAPLSLSQDYYQVLQAPLKELVWFEHSGHNPWMNESAKFAEEVIRVFQ